MPPTTSAIIKKIITKFLFDIVGDDAWNFEPTCPGHSRRKTRLKFKDLDKSIQKLRAIYKVHPEWFEVPKNYN